MKDLKDPPVFTNEQAQLIDEKTIEEFGIDGFTLMEIAASCASDHIKAEQPINSCGLILCGKGNNAGDALAIARHLSESGYSIDIYFVFGTEDLSSDALKNLQLLKKLNSPLIEFVDELDDSTDYEFVVDGILGSGLKGNLDENLQKLIHQVNSMDTTCYSCDIPTGINGDTGEIMGAALQADITFMFGTRKQGCYIAEGFEYSGVKVFCPLPFPNFLLDEFAETHILGFGDNSETYLPKRTHKYSTPPVYIIAGSKGLTGAAILAAKAAWSSGAGAVTAIVPGGIFNAFDAHFTEIMRVQVGNSDDFYFKPNHLDLIFETLEKKPGTILIGPGLGRHPDTIEFVRNFTKKCVYDCVVDADALYALDLYNPVNLNAKAQYVFTPHPGEFKRMFCHKPINTKQIRSVLGAQEYDFSNILVVKGKPVFVLNGKNTLITGYDTSSFNRAGFGDVLSGFICGYWSQFSNPFDSCLKALNEGKIRMNQYFEQKTNRAPVPTDIL